MRSYLTFTATMFAFVSSPALACELDPFLFQLPGETEADARERSEGIMAAYSVKRHLDREDHDFRNATQIYLARVISRAAGSVDLATLPSTKVRAIKSLKGEMPSGEQTLTDEAASGMCDDVGDGIGAYGKVDDLVVVFAGLPKSPYRPRGLDSFRVGQIRTIGLLDQLREFGTNLE